MSYWDKSLRLFSIFLISFLCACQGRYASLNNTMYKCGFKQVAFSEFQACMMESMPEQKTGSPDYYTQTNNQITTQLAFYEEQISKKKMKESEAYADFTTFVSNKVVEEQKSAQVAGAVIAAGLVGAAVATCANNGCGSSYNNNSQQSHQGCCSWHSGMSTMCTSSNQVICNDGWVSSCLC